MESGRKKLRFEIFLERFFTNFHRILLTNLLFAVPSLAILCGMYFLNELLFQGISIPFSLLSIALIYPFYSGVVMVMRNISRGDDGVRVVPTYLSAVKENFAPFLLHGFIISAASIISYLAINLYISLLSKSALMYGALIVSILIALLLLFATFYIPLITITFDVKLRHVYKNSLLMSFGEFKNNCFALFAMIIILAIALTVIAFAGYPIILIILSLALWSLLLPAALTFSYTFFAYDDMVAIMTDKEAISSKIDDSIHKAKQSDKPVQPVVEDYSGIDVSKLKDTDDYIFYNGRMVKQSIILKQLRDQTEKEDKNE